MSKLVWDLEGERFYETGTKNGVLYPIANDGTYPLGVAWNGLTGVSESPSGADANPQYADDIKYLNLISAEEFGGTITAFYYPDEWGECDGSASPSAGVTVGQQRRKKFGLCYRTSLGNDIDNEDYGYKLHLIYGAQASPSSRDYKTINDSPEANEFSWEFTTTPVNVTGYKPTALITIDSTKVSAANLATLEDALYGTANSDPYLPLPDQVLAMVGESAFDIVLNRSNATVEIGKTINLIATTTPAGKTVTWSSGTPAKATVSNGVVTGVADGTAVITASFTEDGTTYSDTCNVTVIPASSGL